MKEYWVNVYEWGGSTLYPNKDNCINWNKGAYKKKLVLYRIHVKMKEPKPKYEPPFIGMKLSNGDWI